MPHETEDFSKSLRISLVSHALLAVTALAATFIFERSVVKVAPSIRVDLVALPDLTKKELTELKRVNQELAETHKEKKEPVREAKEKDEAVALKKEKPKNKKNDLKSAIDRIKALSAIEESDKPKNTYKGNVVSKGNALTGDIANEMNAYVSNLQARLHDAWNLPVWLSKQNLSANVVVFLNRKGFVSNTVFAKPSGSRQFDEYVLKTIRTAQPFGPPPEEILEGGLTLGFPL